MLQVARRLPQVFRHISEALHGPQHFYSDGLVASGVVPLSTSALSTSRMEITPMYDVAVDDGKLPHLVVRMRRAASRMASSGRVAASSDVVDLLHPRRVGVGAVRDRLGRSCSETVPTPRPPQSPTLGRPTTTTPTDSSLKVRASARSVASGGRRRLGGVTSVLTESVVTAGLCSRSCPGWCTAALRPRADQCVDRRAPHQGRKSPVKVVAYDDRRHDSATRSGGAIVLIAVADGHASKFGAHRRSHQRVRIRDVHSGGTAMRDALGRGRCR